MKAAVITLQSVNNYGTQLQLFATQEKLKEYFDEVEFVNFRRKDTYGIGLVKTFTKGHAWKALVVFPTIIRWEKIFGNFQKRYIKISSENPEDMDADVYFTGSDQVWNSGWNNGIIPEYYLDFVGEGKPKYAFSASFGMSEIPEEDVAATKKYLEEYRYITVREESGVNILRSQYGIEQVMQLADPTLAFTGEYWRKFAPKPKIKEPYILLYNLQSSKMFDRYAEELSQRTGLKLYRFCTRFDQIRKNGKHLLIPEVFDFITLIDRATYVLTDSFHATVFSFNLGTEPICFYPNEYSNRISEFLTSIHCEDRHPEDENDFSVLERSVSFEIVNRELGKMREKINLFVERCANE